MSAIQLRAFFVLTRPFFLLGGVLSYLLGVTFALENGTPFHLGYFLLGQLLVTSVQLMVHYANEYYDQDVDRAVTDRTWFSGGSGMLASGILSGSLALRAAWVCLALALVILAAVLSLDGSPLLAALLILTLLAGWFYSAPPLRLVSRGWGEATASLVLAFFVPLTGFLLQTGGSTIPLSLLTLCLPLILLLMGVTLAIEFPDREADAAFGKRTLTVRLGLRRAGWLYLGLIGLAFCLYGLYIAFGFRNPWEGLVFLALPLAGWQAYRLRWQLRHPEASFRWFAAGAVALFAIASFITLVGLVILSPKIVP